jgi:hypothetical protein
VRSASSFNKWARRGDPAADKPVAAEPESVAASAASTDREAALTARIAELEDESRLPHTNCAIR